MSAPLLSIRCLVFNHEPYLRQCLDGFVMQKTDFPFEVIVHDDASTDGSADIIREYAEKYPDIIKPIYETENQYSKHDGSLVKIVDAAMHPDSKYLAMCEGDDYWTDPNKLQLQVAFLENHPDYYMSCHAYTYYFEGTETYKPNNILEKLPSQFFGSREYCTPTIENFFNFSEWFAQILTIVRRRVDPFNKEKRLLYKRHYDYIACYYMMKAGKCSFFRDVMGVYRRHGGGVYSGRDDLIWKEHCLETFIKFHLVQYFQIYFWYR